MAAKMPETNVDRLLEFNERPGLERAGSIPFERYEQFDAQRRQDEALDADAVDMRDLEALEERLKKEGKS